MIKISFEEPDIPEWKKWREQCEIETDKLIVYVQSGGQPSSAIKDIYKDKTIKEKVYVNEEGPFHGKCAYCESPIAHDQYGDIEHFRPAKAVTDIDDNVITIMTDDGEQPHPGYYWLAYDWKNLLFACEKCNRPSKEGDKKIGKHNRFPLKNNSYACVPGDEESEEPLLINPLIENPETHLDIDLKTGILGGSDRGKICIDLFGLNVRALLVEQRKSAYREVQLLLVKYFISDDKEEIKECIINLCKIIKGEKPYSFVGRKAIKAKSQGFFTELEKKCFGDIS